MTIRREVDWFGLKVSSNIRLSGVPEFLFRQLSVGGQALRVEVEQPDILHYDTGTFDESENDSSIVVAEMHRRNLEGPEINRVDVTGGRKWWGKRVRYRWYEDGVNLTVLPPRGEAESA